MTREEFFEKIKPFCENIKEISKCEKSIHYKWLMEKMGDKDFPVKNISKIDAFLKEFSVLFLQMKSDNERDIKMVRIEIWEDIIYPDDNELPAVCVAKVWNTSMKTNDNNLYMSESGDFYNAQKEKIADNTDDFLEYLIKMKCDEHEPVSEKTYSVLRSFGWYEGRRVDISKAIKEREKAGVYFTDIQKEIISEFTGVSGMYNLHYHYYFFKEDDPQFLEKRIIDGKKVVWIGYGMTEDKLYLTDDGRLINCFGIQYGLDIIEGLHVMIRRNSRS